MKPPSGRVMTVAEFNENRPVPLKCDICTHDILDEHPDEMRFVDGKPVHERCFWESRPEAIKQALTEGRPA